MRRDDAPLLDIVLAAQDALEFATGVDSQQFSENRQLQFAVLRALTIVGEAANHLSEGCLADLWLWSQTSRTLNS